MSLAILTTKNFIHLSITGLQLNGQNIKEKAKDVHCSELQVSFMCY